MDLVKMNSQLSTTDLILLIGSILAGALIGLYFTNKNKSINAYMLGDRKLSLIPVAVSLMTSCLSGLTMMGLCAELYYQGPSYSITFLSILIAGPIAAFTMLPILYRMNELSLYSYLHKRFGLTVKYFVTIVFMIQMISYNSVVIYLPAMAVHAIFGLSQHYSILVFGSLCILYSVIGGLKAVVWTDLFQGIMMFLSLILVAAIGTHDAGGFFKVYHDVSKGGRLNLEGFMNMDLTTRHTIIGVAFGVTLKYMYTTSLNQVQIQRALSLPSLRAGQWSFILCSVFGALVLIISSYLGAIIYSAYGPCDPYLGGEIPRRDVILLHYVAHRFGHVPGLRGLFVAGIVSATLSTLSSFANSMAALALQDFVKPLYTRFSRHRRELNDKQTLLIAKILTAVFGLACVLMAYTIEKANSRLLQTTATLLGAIGVPFLASFVLGIFTKFVNSTGIMVGFLINLSLGIYVTIVQVFLKDPLKPAMFVYHTEQCPAVFNKTLDSSQLHPPYNVWTDGAITDGLHKIKGDFHIADISYIMLPAVQFLLMIIVSSVASLLTGGWKQHVPDEYVVKLFGRTPSESEISLPFTHIEKNLKGQYMINKDVDGNGTTDSVADYILTKQKCTNS